MATERPTPADEATLPPRAAQLLQLVRELRNPNRTELASRMGCSPATVGVYTTELRAAGLITPSSPGRYARWRAVNITKTAPPRLLEQATSVWHYARRCQAHNLKEHT